MKNSNEGTIIETVQVYCEESLDPETFQKWEEVKEMLILNRRIVPEKEITNKEMKKENFKTYEECMALAEAGVKIENPEYYWVDMVAWGKSGMSLIPAEEAEFRSTETKYNAFIDFDETVAAYPID